MERRWELHDEGSIRHLFIVAYRQDIFLPPHLKSIRHLFIVAYRPLSCYIRNAISHIFRNFSQKSLADMKIKS